MKKSYFFILFLTIISFIVNGQIVQLQIDKKHSVEISLSTASGLEDIPEGYYETGDTLYFNLRAKGWDISKGDLKDFKDIQINQSEVPAKQVKLPFGHHDTYKDIQRVSLVFMRTSIDFTKRFEFLFEERKSGAMEIPERYWPYYTEFTGYYEKGKQLKDQQQYIASFERLKYIISESDHAYEFTRFSNYSRAYNEIVPEVITSYLMEQIEGLINLISVLGPKEMIIAEELKEVGLAMDSVILVKQMFESYYRITEPTSKDLLQKHEELISDYNEFYQETYEKWKKSVLYVIESGFYQNENKYTVFVELLARLLVYTNQVSILTAYDSIDISLISNPEKEIPFLKHHFDLLESMEFENWKSEFITILDLLNEEIRNNKRIFGRIHIQNLQGQLSVEMQPNYYIINGFNELVDGQFIDFRENMLKAIEKCTDIEMMYYLELQLFSDRYRTTKTKPNLIETVNNGLAFEENRMPNDAIEQYVMANRLGTSALPNFLIGRLRIEYYKDIYTAEKYIKDAIQIYPDFALARIYQIETQIKNKQFNLALSEIEAVLTMPSLSIWYIYFLKATVLYNMGNFKGALHVIQTYCYPLNSKNFKQFILLGDIYLALKDCEKAHDSYTSASDINPNDSKFSASMEKFYTECND